MKANLRVDEAAAILNCSTREVYRLAASGELRGYGFGETITCWMLAAFVTPSWTQHGRAGGLILSGPL